MSARTPQTLFNAYLEYSKLMFGNLFVMNAGSAVALVAFLGNAGADSLGHGLLCRETARAAIMSLAVGAFAAVFATACASQLESLNADELEKKGPDARFHVRLGIVSAVFVISSAVCFVVACTFAADLWGTCPPSPAKPT